MFCPKCGRMNSDDDTNCKGCGAPLHTEEQTPAPEKKKMPKWLPAVLLAAALAAAGICLKSCDAFAAYDMLMIM